MSYKPKTRVTVVAGSTLAELFSVRELSDGGLLLLIKNEENYELNGERVPIVREKISIHPSVKSINGGVTVKREKILNNSDIITSVCLFYPDDEGGVCHPIFTKRTANLDQFRYSTKIHGRDMEVRLFSYSPKKLTLIFSVFVADNKKMPHMFTKSMIKINFKRFSLWIYYSYLNLPTFDASDSVWVATSSEQISGKKRGDDLITDARSYSDELCKDWVNVQTDACAVRMYDRIIDSIKMNKSNDCLIKKLQCHIVWHYSRPIDVWLGDCFGEIGG